MNIEELEKIKSILENNEHSLIEFESNTIYFLDSKQNRIGTLNDVSANLKVNLLTNVTNKLDKLIEEKTLNDLLQSLTFLYLGNANQLEQSFSLLLSDPNVSEQQVNDMLARLQTALNNSTNA